MAWQYEEQIQNVLIQKVIRLFFLSSWEMAGWQAVAGRGGPVWDLSLLVIFYLSLTKNWNMRLFTRYGWSKKICYCLWEMWAPAFLSLDTSLLWFIIFSLLWLPNLHGDKIQKFLSTPLNYCFYSKFLYTVLVFSRFINIWFFVGIVCFALSWMIDRRKKGTQILYRYGKYSHTYGCHRLSSWTHNCWIYGIDQQPW